VGLLPRHVAPEVLQQHRDTAEGAIGQLARRLRSGRIEALADDRVELRVDPGDAVDRGLDELLRARLSAADQLGLSGGVQPRGVGHVPDRNKRWGRRPLRCRSTSRV
jgi:hypothetical protein